jgi:hypothetical protein
MAIASDMEISMITSEQTGCILIDRRKNLPLARLCFTLRDDES